MFVPPHVHPFLHDLQMETVKDLLIALALCPYAYCRYEMRHNVERFYPLWLIVFSNYVGEDNVMWLCETPALSQIREFALATIPSGDWRCSRGSSTGPADVRARAKIRYLVRKDARHKHWTNSLKEYKGNPASGGKVNPDAVHIAHLHAADEQYASEKWENAWKRTIGSRKPDGSFEVAEQQWELAFSKWKVAALIEHKVRAT